MAHYVFSFKNDTVRNSIASWNYNRNKSKLSKTDGVFQLRYLNSKIKKENYSLESVTASKINNIIRELNLCSNDYYGYHIITTSDEYSLYLRLGIEDIIHPKGNCQFTRGYKFDNHEEVYDNLVRIKKEIDEISEEESQIRDQIRSLNISRYEETYIMKMDQIAKRIHCTSTDPNPDILKIGSDLVSNYRTILNEANKEISILEKNIIIKSDQREKKYSEFTDYLDSFRMPI